MNYSSGHSTVHSGISSTMIVFHPYIDVYVCLRSCYILVNLYFLGYQPVWYYMKKPICLIASLAFHQQTNIYHMQIYCSISTKQFIASLAFYQQTNVFHMHYINKPILFIASLAFHQHTNIYCYH